MHNRTSFRQLTLLRVVSVFVFCCVSLLSAHAIERIHVEGRTLRTPSGKIVLRGTNLGNWALREDFMFGLYGTHSQMLDAFDAALGKPLSDTFWEEYEKVYFTEQDARFLQQQGFNLLRVPLNQAWFEDPQKPGAYRENRFARLDELIRVANQHGIYVLLDLHAVTGGQSREIYADSRWGEPEFWRYADFRRRATDLWVAIAKRYRNNPGIAGYDLINEPNTEGHTDLLTQWLNDTHRAIRHVDPSTPIVISGDDWGKDFLGLTDEMWSDRQTIFQFHIYPDFTYPLSNMTEYPGTVDGVRYDRDWLRQHLRSKIAFQKRPVLLGEFGLSINEGHLNLTQPMVRDFLAVAEEQGWSWSGWAYKDIGQMGLVSPKPDTPWKKFLASEAVAAERRKVQHLFKVRALESTSDPALPTTLISLVGWDVPEHRGYNLNVERVWNRPLSYSILKLLKGKSAEDIRAMARSFRFDNCRPNPETMDVFGQAARNGK